MRHEAIKPKPDFKILRFRPEGYVSTSDPEYLDQLIKTVKAKKLDPDQLVFSGFNGRVLADGGQLPKLNAIYAMNLAGWRDALKAHHDTNPAQYAERWEQAGGVPCIGLIDRTQLREVYSHDVPEHPENIIEAEEDWRDVKFEGVPVQIPDDILSDYVQPGHAPKPYDEYIEEREEFINIVPGDFLDSLPIERPIEKGVIHRDFPNGSPLDALVGVVFIDH
jgi:hypothetical protein